MTAPRAALAILLLLSGTDGAGSFHRTLRSGPATLDLRTAGAADAVAITDTITVTLTLEAGPGLEVDPPRGMAPAPAWLLVEQRPPTSEAAAGRWRQVSLIAPLLPGPQTWQPPALRYRDHTTAGWQDIAWPPVEIPVLAPPQDVDRDGLRDITAIEPLDPEPDHSAPRWLWALVPIAALVAIGFYLRTRALRSVPRAPARLALLHLCRLIARELPVKGRAERFVTILTLVLRRYLEQQYHLAARRQTTAELLQAAAGSPSLTPSQRRFLETFLPRCDQIKYAGSATTVQECAALAEDMRRFITESDRDAPSDPPRPA